MADVQTSPATTPGGNVGHTQKQRTPPAGNNQPKRNNKNRKPQSLSNGLPHVDGAMSDSYAMPASPRFKRNVRQPGAVMYGQQQFAAPKARNNEQRPSSTSGQTIPATPAKEQAYAGPTFQASPAPSSLPVPKFFSKSVPKGTIPGSFQSRLEGERTPEPADSSPEPDVVPLADNAQKTPLDMFFKADRAEKERARSGSDTFSPPKSSAIPQAPATVPARFPGKNMFMQELDGQHDDGPSSPIRIPAGNGRPPNNLKDSSTSTDKLGSSHTDDAQREAYTKSLKDMLFSNANTTPPWHGSYAVHGMQSQSNPEFFTPSPFNRSRSGPSTPGPQAGFTDPNMNYHYGNRNLSPLFHAARESPSRPSTLRQELPSPTPPQTTPYGGPQIDPDSFSRNYLDATIRSSLPPQPQQHRSGTSGNQTTYSTPFPQQHSTQTSRDGPQSPTAAQPQAGGAAATRDIGAMEDDLRRMLKLNVMS